MKHLVVGAGATRAEALNLGISPDLSPPLIRDFARKMWEEFSPSPFLELYLTLNQIDPGQGDPRETFFRLEESGALDIERFMEFVWVNRDFQRTRGESPGERISPWENFLYQGIGNPLVTTLIRSFYQDGKELRDLSLSRSVIARLNPDDLVMNLNYDTVFELALRQSNVPYDYVPAEFKGSLQVCKPHGSLNMAAKGDTFSFGDPEWMGMPQPSDGRSYLGLIPPKFNKTYEAHPIALRIFGAVRDRKPSDLVFWGIGFAKGDLGLEEVYQLWARSARSVVVINTSPDVAKRAEELLKLPTSSFPSVEAWLGSKGS